MENTKRDGASKESDDGLMHQKAEMQITQMTKLLSGLAIESDCHWYTQCTFDLFGNKYMVVSCCVSQPRIFGTCST